MYFFWLTCLTIEKGLKSPAKNTALLFFSRSKREESQIKKLVHNREFDKNEKLFSVLISHSKKLIEQSGLPCFTVNSADQRGSDFGERFANAIKSVFDKGFENVITVGNDCPTLSLQDLTKASLDLQNGKDVLGPSTDGGIYLLGIQKRNFNLVRFKKLKWQSGDLFEDICEYFNQKNSPVQILRTQRDLDSNKDLKILLKQNQRTEIVQIISQILFRQDTNNTDSYIDPNFVSQFHQSLGLRGPPNL